VWGGGVEMAINQNWSLKLEGLVADLGHETYVLGPAANGKTANTSVIEHETVTLRAGVNYKF
jgi:opacity protein-like surface antigen